MHIYRRPKVRFTVSEELLYFKYILCVPKIPLRNELLHDFHTMACSGHSGERKTRHKLSQLYYWKTLRQDMTEYIKSCQYVNRRKLGIRNHSDYYSQLSHQNPNGPLSPWISLVRCLKQRTEIDTY